MKVTLKTLVIGPVNAGKASLIQKLTEDSDKKMQNPLTPKQMISMGKHELEFIFEASVLKPENEPPTVYDVILFCFNVTQKASYDQAIELLQHMLPSYQGLFALVGTHNDIAQNQSNNETVLLGLKMDIALQANYPSSYVGMYLSSNLDKHCGVASLSLKLIADKYLHRYPEHQPVLKRVAPVTEEESRPSIDINAIVVGDKGVGKSSLIFQMNGMKDVAPYVEQYQNQLGMTTQCLSLSGHDVYLTLVDTCNRGPDDYKNLQVALLCFDATRLDTIKGLFDPLKLLIENNKKIVFALVGTKYELVIKAKAQKALYDAMTVYQDVLSRLYPYHFIGIYLNSMANKVFDQVDKESNKAQFVINLLCEKYIQKGIEEKALCSAIMREHSETDNHPLAHSKFDKNKLPDLDELLLNASRQPASVLSDLTRTGRAFRNLRLFDPDAPALIQERQASLRLRGASTSKKWS